MNFALTHKLTSELYDIFKKSSSNSLVTAGSEMVWKLVYFRYYVIVIQFCGHDVLSNMANIREGTSEGGKELFEIGEALRGRK